MHHLLLSALLALTAITAHSQPKPPYQYFRIGSPQDVAAQPKAGFALMGGGTDLDDAFRWLCNRANGGDFLILRAAGDDDYNPYVLGLQTQPQCKLNSVATLILPNREAANDPFVASTIRNAEAIFIAGGDQANYTRNWTGTPVQREINAAIERGVPLGGTSAGLAVMGEWAYSAEGDKPDDPNLSSKDVLMNPLNPRITLVHNFLEIPILKGIITDSHFVKRNRIGRLLVFLARIQQRLGDESIHGLGIDEKTAILLEPNGEGRVVGSGTVTLIWPYAPAPKILADKPLDHANFSQQIVKAGGAINVRKWCCGSGPNTLIVEKGHLRNFDDKGPVR